MIPALCHKLRAFIRCESGSVTHFAAVLTVVITLFAGFAVDPTNAWRHRNILRTAADATSRAGVIELSKLSSTTLDAETKADLRDDLLELANANLLAVSRDIAITSSDILFGTWDSDTSSFTETDTQVDAVQVTATRSAQNSSPVPTFFLRLASRDNWNIQEISIAAIEQECALADIATNGMVEMTSNNAIYNSFCFYGGSGIKLSNHNTFSDNSAMYVPSLDDVQLPSSSSMDTIVGRGTSESSASLTYGDVIQESDSLAPNLPDIDVVSLNYLNPYYSEMPSYINTSAAVIEISAKNVRYTSFTPGRIYQVNCGGADGSKAQFFAGAVVSEVVIVAECNLQLGNGSIFEDVVLVTSSTENKSVYGANGVQLGKDDSCADGGGVLIYTAGDVSSAANLQAYGAEIYSLGEVQLAAQANGINGIAIHADGDVKISAQATLGTCKDSSDTNISSVFRIVQ